MPPLLLLSLLLPVGIDGLYEPGSGFSDEVELSEDPLSESATAAAVASETDTLVLVKPRFTVVVVERTASVEAASAPPMVMKPCRDVVVVCTAVLVYIYTAYSANGELTYGVSRERLQSSCARTKNTSCCHLWDAD
jgi:hypothetical protein